MNRTLLAPLLLSLLAMAGCGYQQSNRYNEESTTGGYRWQSLYRQDVQTVAVPIFTNTSFDRGVELRLTKAVINQLETLTPYKVTERGNADTILEGRILSVNVNPLSEDLRTSIPQEQLLTMRVNLLWKDVRTGRVLMERKNFEQSVVYYPTLGEATFHGSQHAIDRLALAVVQEMQADW